MKNNKFDLNLREPEMDYEVKKRYFSLTPEQYVDFIETGLKLLPDLKAAIKKRKEEIPTVKFKL